MGKQEKAAKKKKKAAVEADAIIAEAVAKVKSRPVTKYDAERVEGVSDEDFALGVRCRELREEGEAWWAIAKHLELPGSGESAAAGKKGAARARTVYKTAFGSFPRTFQTGAYKGKVERNERVRELSKIKKADRKAAAKAGKSVIGPEVPDEEVAEMLKGKRIKWFILSDVTGPAGMEQDACVHPTATLEIEGEGLDRVIHFREQHRRAPAGVREWPAHMRTVRLRQIFQVK